jgi:hypothetical protein
LRSTNMHMSMSAPRSPNWLPDDPYSFTYAPGGEYIYTTFYTTSMSLVETKVWEEMMQLKLPLPPA